MKQTEDQMGRFLIRVAWITVVCLLAWAVFWVATRYLLPFVLGFLIAWLLKPLIVKISVLLKIRRKFTAMAVTLLLYLLLAGLLWWIGAALISQAIRFLQQFPPQWQTLWQEKLLPLWDTLQLQLDRLLERMNIAELSSLWGKGGEPLSALLSEQAHNLWEKGLQGFTGFVSALPSFLFTLSVTVLASLFITMDYKNVSAFLARQLPEKYCRWIGETKANLLQTMGKMCKAYLILMLVTFGELFVSLLLLRVDSALLISAVIALADLLPLIGTGGIMIPWVILELVQGNYFLAAGLAMAYAIITLVRTILEPKILGRQIGLHPVIALFSMYTGVKLFGFWGLLLMPLLVLTLKDLNDTGKISLWKTDSSKKSRGDCTGAQNSAGKSGGSGSGPKQGGKG